MTNSTRKVLIISIIISVGMFAFSFALAPLYNTFCKITGINVPLTEKEFFEKADLNREITIQFTTVNNKNINWDFYPRQTSIIVHPGEDVRVLFFAKNKTTLTMIVQAIPSIVPTMAITHFHKIQCFCFQQQILRANESKDMPVIFHVDKSLPQNIHTITLAYTLFDVTSQKKRISL